MGEKIPETEIGGPGGSFQSTLWSIVIKAKDPTSRDRAEALEKLINTYWKPLYFFVRRKGNSVEASKDLIQGFFASLLEKDFLKNVDRGRGRFRTFLLTALEHYVADEFDRANAQKRGGAKQILSLDFVQAEQDIAGAQVGDAPDRAFRHDWAVRVMAQAMEQIRSSFEGSGRASEFEAFRSHLTSTRPEGVSYEEIARKLGVSVEDVGNRIRSVRLRYRDAILEVVRSYTDSAEETMEELKDLFSAFS